MTTTDPTATPDTVQPAAAVLSVPPDLPTPTPGAAPPAPAAEASTPAAPAPAAAPAADPPKDRTGAAWDPAIHETPARLNSERKWARLRGNAQRKAAGKPLAGTTAGMQPRPAAAPAAPAAPAAAPAAPASPSVLVIPKADQRSGATPGASGQEVDGKPEAAAGPLPPEAYDASAAALTGGMFGLAAIAFGKAWEPTTAERSAWVEAWRRLFLHYGWRPLNPLVEVCVLAVGSIAKRRDDPETRAKVGGMWSWFRRRTSPTVADVAAGRPEQQQPQQQPAPRDPAQPEAQPAAPAHPLARW
jgi:hypothetical protein